MPAYLADLPGGRIPLLARTVARTDDGAVTRPLVLRIITMVPEVWQLNSSLTVFYGLLPRIMTARFSCTRFVTEKSIATGSGDFRRYPRDH